MYVQQEYWLNICYFLITVRTLYTTVHTLCAIQFGENEICRCIGACTIIEPQLFEKWQPFICHEVNHYAGCGPYQALSAVDVYTL